MGVGRMTFELDTHIKQQLINAKAFGILDYIEKLEKENEELKKTITEKNSEVGLLEATIGEQLKDKVELYKQIEKMKCCHNCRKFIDKSYCITPCEEHSEWELTE